MTNGPTLWCRRTRTVHGRVPGGQPDLAVGNGTEPTITVTVTY